jgi:N-carbamoyl-L-amino-acid hydrolase
MTSPHIDADRLGSRFDAFNEIGATAGGGVSRPALSDANREARERLVEWFEAAGLAVTVDGMGNLFGRREGTDTDAAPVLVGSHVDSQDPGGRYDGLVGVLGGLEVVAALNDADVDTRRPVEVVAWTNEEGVRFQPDLLGSGVFTGRFDLETAYAAADEAGVTVREELERIGYLGEAPCEPRDLHCYLELHVEQGPVLDDAGRSVAVVEAVYGFTWLAVELRGQADHAGPTPMDSRRDALVGASDVVRAVRRLAPALDEDAVGTVGNLTVEPGGVNVVPETVAFTVDLRAPEADVIETAVEQVREEVRWAARREGLDSDVEELVHVPPSAFDPDLVGLLADAADDAGYDPLRMDSGAGHDAGYLARLCPTGMVFVPSVDGISHSEDEFTDWEDVVAGVEVLREAVERKATE